MLYPHLTDYQKEMIDKFTPPKYTKWVYKQWEKYLNLTLFILLLICFPIAALQDYIPAFLIIKINFFVISGLGLLMLSGYLVKHFYTRKYAKKIGLSIKEWNYWTSGMTFNL